MRKIKGAWIRNKSSHRWMNLGGRRRLAGDWFYTKNQSLIDKVKSADRIWELSYQQPEKVKKARKMNKERGKLKRKEEDKEEVRIRCVHAEKEYKKRIARLKKQGKLPKDAQAEKAFYVYPNGRYQKRYCMKKNCEEMCIMNPKSDLRPTVVDEVAKEIADEIEKGQR